MNDVNNLDINENPSVRWHHSIEDAATNYSRTRCHNGRNVCNHEVTAKNKRKCSKNPIDKMFVQSAPREEAVSKPKAVPKPKARKKPVCGKNIVADYEYIARYATPFLAFWAPLD